MSDPRQRVIYADSRHSVGNVPAANFGLVADWLVARLNGKPLKSEFVEPTGGSPKSRSDLACAQQYRATRTAPQHRVTVICRPHDRCGNGLATPCTNGLWRTRLRSMRPPGAAILVTHRFRQQQ